MMKKKSLSIVFLGNDVVRITKEESEVTRILMSAMMLMMMAKMMLALAQQFSSILSAHFNNVFRTTNSP